MRYLKFHLLTIALLFAYDTAAVAAPRKNVDPKNGQSALHLAAFQHKRSLVEALIKAKANVNLPDSKGHTPLMLAAMNAQDPAILKLLIDANANVNAQNAEGKTALYYAMVLDGHENGFLANAQILLKHHADPNLAEVRGDTPLMVAVRNDSFDAVKLLVAYRANINQPDQDRKTALFHGFNDSKNYWRIGIASEEVLRFLLANKANAGPIDVKKTSLLSYLPWSASTEFVQDLINAGADVNSTSSPSPLEQALWSTRTDLIRLYLKSGLKLPKDFTAMLYKAVQESLNAMSIEHLTDLNQLIADSGIPSFYNLLEHDDDSRYWGQLANPNSQAQSEKFLGPDLGNWHHLFRLTPAHRAELIGRIDPGKLNWLAERKSAPLWLAMVPEPHRTGHPSECYGVDMAFYRFAEDLEKPSVDKKKPTLAKWRHFFLLLRHSAKRDRIAKNKVWTFQEFALVLEPFLIALERGQAYTTPTSVDRVIIEDVFASYAFFLKEYYAALLPEQSTLIDLSIHDGSLVDVIENQIHHSETGSFKQKILTKFKTELESEMPQEWRELRSKNSSDFEAISQKALAFIKAALTPKRKR